MQYAARVKEAVKKAGSCGKAIDDSDDASSAGSIPYEGRRCSIRSAPGAVPGIEFDIPNPWKRESLRR